MGSSTKPFRGILHQWALHGYRSSGRRYLTGQIGNERYIVTSYIQSMEPTEYFVRGVTVETMNSRYQLGEKR